MHYNTVVLHVSALYAVYVLVSDFKYINQGKARLLIKMAIVEKSTHKKT